MGMFSLFVSGFPCALVYIAAILSPTNFQSPFRIFKLQPHASQQRNVFFQFEYVLTNLLLKGSSRRLLTVPLDQRL